jgi:hypothetical protein
MEDLSDILKKHFFGLYKKRNEAFETVQERVVKMNEQRKTNRHDAVFAKRKIPTDMSPVAATPRHEKTPPKRPQTGQQATGNVSQVEGGQRQTERNPEEEDETDF